jgi:DNA processing protein
VVIEAGLRSGSLITARNALEQGRDVFAVPGDLISSSFLGTNQLIQNGAIAVFSPNDILETYYARYYDKLGNVKSYGNDEIMLRTQKYLRQIEREEKESGIITSSHEVKEKKPVFRSSKNEIRETRTKPPVNAKKEAPSYLTESAKKIYDFLSDEPKHIDEIINCCGFTTEKTLSSVTELEIYGLVEQLSGRRYKVK